jgi:hypothetical protein
MVRSCGPAAETAVHPSRHRDQRQHEIVGFETRHVDPLAAVLDGLGGNNLDQPENGRGSFLATFG